MDLAKELYEFVVNRGDVRSKTPSSNKAEHELPPNHLDTKYKYLLKVAITGAGECSGEWARGARSREEAMTIAHDWCKATKAVDDPEWYMDRETGYHHWNHDKISFVIKPI